MTVTIYHGHVIDVLKELPAESAQMVCTSPPYWGLRNYNLPPTEWPAVSYSPMPGLAPIEVPGCEEGCRHEWKTIVQRGQTGGKNSISAGGVLRPRGRSQPEQDDVETAKCVQCGGWRGTLGLEPTPEMYTAHLVAVFREVRRVLRGDGVLWLNLGDSYASQGGVRDNASHDNCKWQGCNTEKRNNGVGLKPKDLINIPHRVALALQADGWWHRSTIIWAKGLSFANHTTKCPHCGKKHDARYSGSSMPESVRDRCTTSHEYVFMFSKSERYFYDYEGVKEPSVGQGGQAANFARETKDTIHPGQGATQHRMERTPTFATAGRNLRSVWAINPGSFPGTHFATFPPSLITPMISAGTSPRGCCPECGMPWSRVVAYPDYRNAPQRGTTKGDGTPDPRGFKSSAGQAWQDWKGANPTRTLGWRPNCKCSGLAIISRQPSIPRQRKDESDSDYTYRLSIAQQGLDDWWERWDHLRPLYEQEPTIPCAVLDPFLGAGTTSLVCEQLGRDSIGIELSQKYVEMSRERIVKDISLLAQVNIVEVP